VVALLGERGELDGELGEGGEGGLVLGVEVLELLSISVNNLLQSALVLIQPHNLLI